MLCELQIAFLQPLMRFTANVQLACSAKPGMPDVSCPHELASCQLLYCIAQQVSHADSQICMPAHLLGQHCTCEKPGVVCMTSEA